MRDWPIPPVDRTVHLVPDTQGIVVPTAVARRLKVLDDLARPSVPDVAHRLQVGDLIAGGTESFPAAVAMMDAMGSGEWWATVGNHDYFDAGITAAEAATHMGMPGTDFTVDLGHSVVVVTFLRADAAWGDAYDPTWLDSTLTQHAGRHCIILAHPPMESLPDWGVVEPVLAEHHNVVAWVNGHTHAPASIKTLAVGGRDLPQIDCGALHYTIPSLDWFDPLVSLYLTVEDDRLEVRFRDHGAHQWVGLGVDRVWNWPLA